MGHIFAKEKKPSKVTEQDKAILQLKQQRDKMKVYQKKVELQIEKDRLSAKAYLANKNIDKAKLLLRKKKFLETQLEKSDGQLENIERMVHDLEFAQIEVQVVNGLKKGNEALEKLNKMLLIEDIEKILDDTKEAAAYQQEITDLLSGSLTAEDEEDVERELDRILQDSINLTSQLPDVPNTSLPSKSPEKSAEKTSRKKVAVEAS